MAHLAKRILVDCCYGRKRQVQQSERVHSPFGIAQQEEAKSNEDDAEEDLKLVHVEDRLRQVKALSCV